jgi:hypothetical protein
LLFYNQENKTNMTQNEIVSHDNNQAAAIAEYAQSIEAWRDPVTRRDYFEQLSENDFLELTQRFASIVRKGDADNLQAFDGKNVALMTHDVPDYDDKEQLLRETWTTARSLLKDQSIPDDDALEYAALTVAGGILYVHPFIDGNGRTSRALSYVMATGGEGEQALDNMLANSLSSEWQVTPHARVSVPVRGAYTGEQPKEIGWEFQFAGEGEDALGGRIVDSNYSNEIIRSFLEVADDYTKQLVESCATRAGDGTLEKIDGDKLLETLVSDPDRGIDYARQMTGIERALRANYVRQFLAGMRSDVRHQPRVIKDSELVTSEDDTEHRKQRAHMLGVLLAERTTGGAILPRDEAVIQHRGYSDAHHRDV